MGILPFVPWWLPVWSGVECVLIVKGRQGACHRAGRGASGRALGAPGDDGRGDHTGADRGENVGKTVQAGAAHRGAEDQPQQAGREDGPDVAEGLELPARGAHLRGRSALVERRLKAEVVETGRDA